MNSRDKVLDIVKTRSRNYPTLIRLNPELYKWVCDNSDSRSNCLKSRIFAAVYDIDLECPYGKIRVVRHEWDKAEKRLHELGIKYALSCKKVNGKLCDCTKELYSEQSIKAHGAMSVEQKEEIKKKKEETNTARYGKPYISQVKGKMPKKILIPLDVYSKLNNHEWLDCHYVRYQKSALEIGNQLEVDYTTVIEYLRKHGYKIRKRSRRSEGEKQVERFIKSLKMDVDSSNFTIASPLEVDIAVHIARVGIEYNGLRWHSSNILCDQSIPDEISKSKHILKTDKAKHLGYELLHINEYDWKYRQRQTKYYIKRKLGKVLMLNGSDCHLSEVPLTSHMIFSVINHMDDYIPADYAVGLYYKDKLVASVGYTIKENAVELVQVVFLGDHYVSDGIRTIVDYLSKMYKCDVVMSCDRMRSSRKEMIDNGMTFIGTSKPSFRWTDTKRLFSKEELGGINALRFCKKFMPEKPIEYNLFLNRFRRYVDCGRNHFIYKFDISE